MARPWNGLGRAVLAGLGKGMPFGEQPVRGGCSERRSAAEEAGPALAGGRL